MINLITANKYCESVFDGTHDSPKANESGFPLITSKNILNGVLNLNDTYLISEKDYLTIQNRSSVKKWDIIFSMIGSVGEVYLEKNNEIPYAIKNVGVFSTNDEFKAKWLYYYLKSPYAKIFIKNSLAGAVQKFLSLGKLRDFPIFQYDRSKDDTINFLSALDDKIELNNQINTELEAMAKTLYDYWFVQFDFPDENGKPYQSSGGKMVFNETLKREIPVGWEVTVFNDWISKTKTGDWGKEAVEGNYTEHVYCVRGADINGLNGKGEVKAPERFILKNNLVKSLKPNDFVVEISGGSPTQSTGRIALLTEASLKRFDSNVICSNFCKALSLKDDEYVFNFLQEWQRLYDAGVFFGYEGKTSGIKNFLFDSFMTSYDIVKPPKNLVEKFYKQVETLENKKQINLQQNQELAQLRDWLLPMLMNGQVSVGSGEYDREEVSLGMVGEGKY